MSEIRLDARPARLERQVLGLSILCGSLFIALGIGGYLVLPRQVHADDSAKVIYAKGLVIEDNQGKARVLLGAPFPNSKDRLRQDGQTQAMVFLDQNGHDRLTIGEEPGAQVNGKADLNWRRIAPGFGVLIHDDQGNERGGFGWLGNGRAAFVLDRPGLDAIGAYVDDKSGFAGMVVEYPPDIANDVNGIELGTQGNRGFLRFKDVHNQTKATLELKDGLPSWDVPGKQIQGSPSSPMK